MCKTFPVAKITKLLSRFKFQHQSQGLFTECLKKFALKIFTLLVISKIYVR